MYTQAEQAEIDRLKGLYDKAVEVYNYESGMNSQGNQIWEQYTKGQRPNLIFPFSGQVTDEGSFLAWLEQSRLATARATANVQSAELAYTNYLDQVYAKYVTNNPEVAAATQAAKVAAQADIIKNADNKKFMQTTTKYLIIGAVVITIVVIGIWIYRKKYASS